jgi:predicted amidophosphoribosyltransferase
MKTCQNCGRPLRLRDTACPNCGPRGKKAGRRANPSPTPDELRLTDDELQAVSSGEWVPPEPAASR